jgi:hypothetical protein
MRPQNTNIQIILACGRKGPRAIFALRLTNAFPNQPTKAQKYRIMTCIFNADL